MMTGISRQALTAAVTDRLDGVEVLEVFRGEVDTPPKLEGDDEGRVAPYAVVYPSPGTPTSAAASAADDFTALDWTVQVTVVAGYAEDLDAAVDRVDAALLGWAPVIEEAVCSRLRPPAGFDPGPARRNDDVEPPRHYLPLIYGLTATR